MLTVEHPNFAVKKTSYDAIPGTKDVKLDPPAVIEGRVVDGETGKPAANVIVGVGTARTNNLVPAADMTYSYHRAVTRTDEQGNYRFSTLPIGTYDLWAEMPGRVNEGETGVATAADRPTIVPDLKLIIGVPVTIGLTDHKSGKPLKVPVGTQASVGAQLIRLNTIGRSDGTQRATANSDGKFEIRAIPGRNRIWVNGVDVDGEMKWLGNELEEIDVVKAQPASVDIKVMDADEAQVTGTFSTAMTAPRPSRKQLEVIVETTTAALEKDPDSAETLIARAQALQNLGEYRKAIADYEWLMDLNPQQQINVIAHNNLAYILSTAPDEKLRDGKRALELAKKAVDLNPTIADVHDSLAAAYAELGDFDKAIESQQKAIELRPEGKSVREHLKLYEQKKPLRENPSTNESDAPEDPANDEGASLNGETTEDSHEDDEHTHITIIVAKRGLIHDGKVIEWADVERLITAEPDSKLVHPTFKFTRSGAETHQDDLRAKIWDFRKRVALHGHSWGSVSPDEYAKYDAIQKPTEPAQEDNDAKPADNVELGAQRIRVVDESDKPIAGVTIRSEQFSTDEDKRIEWVKRTDANGRASLPYPRNMVERYGIQSATFTFTHPHFVPKYDSVSLGAREAVVKLVRGGQVEITGVAEDGWNVGTLYAYSAKLDPRISWSRSGAKTIRSPQLAAGETFVRAVSFRKDGSTLFSSVRPVDVETGELTKLSVELRPGFKLEGALDGNVPRPVRNGRVLLSISADFDSGWSDWTTVREDGTFTFDSLPPDSGAKAQLVAVCEGFVSATNSEQYPDAGIVIPQTFALGSTGEMAVVEMQPAGNCTVKLLDPAGKPLAGVRVQAMPNYLVGLNGTTSLGTVGGTKEMLLQGRDYQPRPDLGAFPYQATSNSDGVVELSNLPPFQMYLTAANDDYELPRDPSFYPLAMPITRMQVKSGGMSRVNLTLVPIKTTR
jgi:tetratricopeptide (TPR) repeat protein